MGSDYQRLDGPKENPAKRRLMKDLHRSHTELEEAYEQTLEAMMGTLQLRDDETEEHGRRVAHITEMLARSLGLPEAEIRNIRRGAMLHDIGKIGIPDRILRKEGPLDEEEWVIMRRHPQIGYNFLKPIRYLAPALDIPYCHHEKWDGSGYPRGLAGKQIPLAARLFAPADVWDALLSDRPYRKAWPAGRVIDYFHEQSGKHFDPVIVSVFLNTIH